MFRRVLFFLPVLALAAGFVVARFPSHAQADANFQNVPSAQANIHLALLFNYNLANKAVEAGKVDYVWGAQAKVNTVATNDPAPGVAHTYYTMFTEANEAASLAWFQTNHPDWLVYKCDRTSVAMVGNQIPLDVTNPAVQDFELQWITQAMDGGYQGVGFDNAATYNFFAKCGHFDTAGSWVQQFNGKHFDPAYRSALTTAFHQLTDKVRAAAAARNIPFYITINGGPNLWENQQAWYDLLPYLDFVVDEDGFTNGGYSSNNRLTSEATDTVGNAWLTKMQELQYLQNTLGKGVILAAQEPYAVNNAGSAPEGDVQWVLANYLMARGSHAYQALITGNQQYGGPVVMQTDYGVKIGDPTGDMYSAQGVYLRPYSNGLVIVNPSVSSSYSVNLSGSYVDVNGKSVGSTVNVPATGGLILLDGSQAAATSTPMATSVPTSTVVPTSTAAPTATLAPTSTPTPAATSTTVPTSTALPTSTPVSATSTPTTVGMGGAQELLVNPGFESGLSGWSGTRGGSGLALDNVRVHTGSYALAFCGVSSCGGFVEQTVTLPTTLSQAILSYWVYVTGPNSGACPDLLYAQLSSSQRQTLGTIVTHCAPTTLDHWMQQSADVTPLLQHLGGQSLNLKVRAITTAATATRFYLDDVRLDVR